MVYKTLDDFARSRGFQMDVEMETVSYRIEIRMFYTNYKNLPFSQLFERFNNNVTTYMRDAFRYRMIVSNIMCIVSTWEQQLFNFCNKFIKNTSNYYPSVKNKFITDFGVDANLFVELEEYRDIDNVLKHGESSNSYKKLQKANSDFIIKNNEFDDLKKSNFNMPILNINDTNIFDLCDKIERFWENIVSFSKQNI